MNCLWIILLLSCFGDGGFNMGGCCGNDRSRGNCGCDDDSGCGGSGQSKNCRRAVEKAVSECGSERAVMRALKERDRDCDCASERECGEAREERAERRAERMAENNGCDVSGMAPPRWQDFPEVSRSSSRDDCGCDN